MHSPVAVRRLTPGRPDGHRRRAAGIQAAPVADCHSGGPGDVPRGRRERVATGGGVLPYQVGDVHRSFDAAGVSDAEVDTSACEGGDAVTEQQAGDAVDHDVDASALGDACDTVGQGSAGQVDHVLVTSGASVFRLVGAACRGQDQGCAELAGHLHGAHADRAADAWCQDGAAGLQPGHPGQYKEGVVP